MLPQNTYVSTYSSFVDKFSELRYTLFANQRKMNPTVYFDDPHLIDQIKIIQK